MIREHHLPQFGVDLGRKGASVSVKSMRSWFSQQEKMSAPALCSAPARSRRFSNLTTRALQHGSLTSCSVVHLHPWFRLFNPTAHYPNRALSASHSRYTDSGLKRFLLHALVACNLNASSTMEEQPLSRPRQVWRSQLVCFLADFNSLVYSC